MSWLRGLFYRLIDIYRLSIARYHTSCPTVHTTIHSEEETPQLQPRKVRRPLNTDIPNAFDDSAYRYFDHTPVHDITQLLSNANLSNSRC